MRALLYARTLRHLRPVQVYGRALKGLRSSGIDERPAPPVRRARPLTAPADRDPVLVGPTRVALLGAEGDLAAPGDWDDPERSALWRYHAHYFDDLRARDGAARAPWNAALIARWLREVRPGEGVGWDPYPTSLRIVNWARAGLGTGALSPDAVQSLAAQARHLRRHLEVHLLGNHLLANAKALVFAGTYFTGDEADEWRAKGLDLLQREVSEQVLADGGHFERSAMYHSIVLEDLLDLVALSAAAPETLRLPAAWTGVIERMRAWLRVMCHPDGEIALFNDAAHGQAPSPAALEDYAARLGLAPVAAPRAGVRHLAESGYVRVEVGDLVALLDVAEIGPSYLPGHAHADTLSFEASLGGARWIVDSGTSHYAPGAERLRQRGTAAHNTVEVDGQDSSEVWSAFRVARRAHPRDLAIDETRGEVRVACAHDGYRRLAGRVVHRRRWCFAPTHLEVQDELTGRYTTAVARFHLHPDATLAPSAAQLRCAGRDVHVEVEGARATAAASTWHPRFGAAVPSQMIEAPLAGPRAVHRFHW